jgi:hypothetical protein
MSILNNNVAITLGDEPFNLVPSLRAAMTVCEYFGGFLEADKRLKAFDLRAVAFVIEVGLGKVAPKNVQEVIYETGIAKLLSPAIEFIGILANGGKRYVPEAEAPSEGNEHKAAA